MAKRKIRAIHKSPNDKKKILELHEEGLKPAEIQRHFNGKYSYWQIYNTINPRDVYKSNKVVNDDGDLVEEELKEDCAVSDMPDVDLSQFGGIEKFLEHEVTVLSAKISSKKISDEKRVWLLKQIVEINKKLKAQQIETYLKNANAKLVIRIMRRLNPEITDDEILKIYKEEAEKIKQGKN